MTLLLKEALMGSNASLLTTFLQVSNSSLHGKGVFAKQDIKPGTLVGFFKGKILKATVNDIHVIWYEDEKSGEEIGLLVRNRLKYLNHSKKANAEIGDDFGIRATKKIRTGTEVTINYGPGWT